MHSFDQLKRLFSGEILAREAVSKKDARKALLQVWTITLIRQPRARLSAIAPLLMAIVLEAGGIADPAWGEEKSAAEAVFPLTPTHAWAEPLIKAPAALPSNFPEPSSGSALALEPDLDPNDPLAQITSVSQLRDVQPTDWAFQALQSLVERYGCIAGYPDGTYRGNRAITRYEFAAGLNACLDRVNELIASATADLVSQDDLVALGRLQEEFQAELATLRGRVDALEARTAELEANQFSTTTKLTGQIFFNLTSAFTGGDDVLAERRFADNAFAAPPRDAITNRPRRLERGNDDTSTTLGYYALLNLNTSFTGKDSLVTQLAVGNSTSPANALVSAGFFNSWGVPFTDQTGTPTTNQFVVRELFYQFPVGQKTRITVGPRLNYYRHFDGNRYTSFLTGASSFNASGSTLLNAIDRGSGAVVTWNMSPTLQLTGGYLAENTEFLNPAVFNTSNRADEGLFGGSNTVSAQLAYTPSSNFNLKLIYARSRIKAYNGFLGGAVGEPLPYGYADDGFGGSVRDGDANAFVANFDWTLGKHVGLFGRYSYGTLEVDPVNPARGAGTVKTQSFQVGLGFPDLGKKGALGVISFLVPHDYLSGTRYLLSGRGDGGTQSEVELSYYYPLTANVAVVPAFYAIFNPNNFESNPTAYVANVRTQFRF